MRVLALLLTFGVPTFAAERLPAPRAASTAQLKAALTKCKGIAEPADRCFNLQLALSAALREDGEGAEAEKIANAARGDVQDVWAAADDIYISAQSKAQRPDATTADKAAYARATATWKRLWIDQAIASEAQGMADASRGYHRAAADSFARATSIRQSYGDGPANRDARIRAAASAAVGTAGAEGVAAGEAAIRPVLVEAQRVYGDAHPLTAAIKLDLADMLAARTAYADAEKLYGEARPILRRDPAAEIEADSRYARFLVRADRKREAEPIARDVLARLLTAKAGEARVATAYLDIAAIVPLEDALALTGQAVALRTRRFGDKHLETARANIAYARLLERLGRLSEAEQVRRPALIAIQAAQYIQHPETATAYLELGENVMQQNRFKDAAHYLRTAMRAFDETAGPQSAGAARAALMLAVTVSMTGEEDPRPLVLRAIPAIRAALAPAHSERIEAEFILALIVYNVERDIPAALRQIRLVTDASLERARSFPDFGGEAQREMKRLAPAFAVHVRLAWETSQLQLKR
ncbi:tetratricopeptide repeat protein [Sphingomonas sp. LT1P40]|uniref:tetratricopeptide repeat protein n=1 Tax=Alteristakelama amylovorans TaxID=3096166 RepID=UPI002FCC611E